MLSKIIIYAFGVAILGIIFQVQEVSGSGNGTSVTIPINRRIEGLGARKCFLYVWEGVCDNQNCTITIYRSLVKTGSKGTVSIGPFKAFTTGNTQAVCFYDPTSEASTCCNSIRSGASAHAQSTSFGDFEKIEFEMERKRMFAKVIVDDSFILPWKEPCYLHEPCKPYGTCKTPQPDVYNCTCNSGWMGRNCTERAEWAVSIGKCLKDTQFVKDLPVTLDACITACKNMNTKEKIGCKSFEFTTGSCRLYSVSKMHDGKEFINCIQWYFDMKVLPNGVTTTSASLYTIFVLTFLSILHM